MNNGKRIILIDDDQLNNLISAKIIRKFSDYTVESFTLAREALAHLRALDISDSDAIPELIFLDINMPEMDGWEFLEHFKEFPAPLVENCSVVMLTSSIDTHDIERSRKYKCVRQFISKPLTVENLALLTDAIR